MAFGHDLVLGIETGVVVPELNDTVVIVTDGVVVLHNIVFPILRGWWTTPPTQCIIWTPRRMLYPLWFCWCVCADKHERAGGA